MPLYITYLAYLIYARNLYAPEFHLCLNCCIIKAFCFKHGYSILGSISKYYSFSYYRTHLAQCHCCSSKLRGSTRNGTAVNNHYGKPFVFCLLVCPTCTELELFKRKIVFQKQCNISGWSIFSGCIKKTHTHTPASVCWMCQYGRVIQ